MKNEINEERRMKNEELTKHEGRKTRSKNRRKRTLRAHSSFLILHFSFICFLLCLTGCRTAAPPLDYRALVRAADRLGVDIGPKDHQSACDAASCAKATWCSSTAANDDVPTT